MEIRKFKEVLGIYLETIPGQSRYGVGQDDLEDFYELEEWTDDYQGNILIFYDFESGRVYRPFEKLENIAYKKPIFYGDYFYFLRGDFKADKMSIIKYRPGDEPKTIYERPIAGLELYNLNLMEGPIHLTMQDGEVFRSYYPRELEISLGDNESVMAIGEDRIYIDKWVEEGIVDDMITYDYKYYNKFIVRDLRGRIISEEVGNLQKNIDGSWWIS